MYKENNDTVIMRKEGKVAVVTLNRPARYNAITEEMKWGLLHIFTDIQQDTNIKAVVLTGNGKGFCNNLEQPTHKPFGIISSWFMAM